MKELCPLWMLLERGLLLPALTLQGLQMSCDIARNGWLKDMKRRGDPALHC